MSDPRVFKAHRWGEPDRVTPQTTLRTCKRCGCVCHSRHEGEGAFVHHWKEYYVGGSKVHPRPECRFGA